MADAMKAGEPRLLTADFVVPMEGDDLCGEGGVVVEGGRIAAVGGLSALRTKFGELPREHTRGVMLPGFVNGHVHLELGYQEGMIGRPARFMEWIAALMKNYPSAEQLEQVVTAAVRGGIGSSLAAGVTCAGDISRQSLIARQELAGSRLRAVSFGEVMGLGKLRGRLQLMLDAAADGTWASEQLRIGLSPHAPYTVEGPSLAAIVERAVAERMPVAMHLGELSDEAAFLEDLSGELGREAEVTLQMDLLDAAIPLSAGGPLRWARQWGLLGKQGASRRIPVVLAHVNYCDDTDLDVLAESEASVAYCPRTREYFGHDAVGPHRYREMLEAGVNVCLGTDSLASNPDLCVLREARLLHVRDQLSPKVAMEMVTWRGAQALGIQAGRLEAGREADLVVLPREARSRVSLDVLLRELLIEAPAPNAVWVGGKRVI